MANIRTGYHHGDLRTALLDACLTLIETDGIGAVSVRQVAKAAGVSPGAPYHHFTDRSALLAALSTRGFELLGARLTQARDTATDAPDALHAMLTAYLGFATAQPEYFRLMFRPELSQPDKHPDTAAAGEAALAVLAGVVAELSADRGDPDAGQALTVLCWSVGHGLASLWVDGHLAHHAADRSLTAPELVDRVATLFQTLLTTPPPSLPAPSRAATVGEHDRGEPAS